MSILSLLLIGLGASVALSLLGAFSRRAALSPEPALSEAKVLPVADSGVQNSPVQAALPAPTETPRYSLIRAALGLLFVPVEVMLLLLNSYVIAQTAEVVFNRAGEVLGVLSMPGWERELTDFDFFGALIALSQFVAGAALFQALRAAQRSWFLLHTSALAVFSLVLFEVVAAFFRGLVFDVGENQLWTALLNGLAALSIATVEILVGVFVLDFFLAPLLAMMAEMTAKLSSKLTSGGFSLTGNLLGGARGAGVGFFRALDEAVMQPLRALDAILAAAFRPLTTRQPKVQSVAQEHSL